MTGDPGIPAATVRFCNRRADVNGNTEIRALDVVYESFHVCIIVKDRRYRRVAFDAGDDFFRVGPLIAFPVSCRIQILSWTEHAAFGGVADVHGMMLQRQAQEGAVFLDQIVIVDSAARHGENDEVVARPEPGSAAFQRRNARCSGAACWSFQIIATKAKVRRFETRSHTAF